MREKPSSPELANFDLPKPPLPWEPSKRFTLLKDYPDGAFWRITAESELDIREPLNEYFSWVEERYILPGNVAGVVRDTLRHNSLLASMASTTQTEDEYYAMLKRFEQEYLGLKPVNGSSGLRWWESSAGFGSGQYPTDTIAALVNMEPYQFLEYVRVNKAPIGWITLKSDDFLIPTTDNNLSEEVVTIDGIQELTPIGNELLKEILNVYEKGLNSKHIQTLGKISLQE